MTYQLQWKPYPTVSRNKLDRGVNGLAVAPAGAGRDRPPNQAVFVGYLSSGRRKKQLALKRLLSPRREISLPPWKKVKEELEQSMRREIERWVEAEQD